MNENNLLDNSVDLPVDTDPIEALAKLDPIELARRKYESDKYIKTLESRQDEFRKQYMELEAKYNARAKLEEVYDRTQSSDNPNAKEAKAPEIDLTKIESLVEQKIRATEKAKQESANFEMVKNKLKEKYGSNYNSKLQAQIEDLEMTPEHMNELARRNPKTLIKLLGLNEETPFVRDPFQAPPKNTLNSFAPNAPKKRTWSYYQDLKQKDPKAYLSKETTVQMHKDYQELGREFEDGDFKRFRDGI